MFKKFSTVVCLMAVIPAASISLMVSFMLLAAIFISWSK